MWTKGSHTAMASRPLLGLLPSKPSTTKFGRLGDEGGEKRGGEGGWRGQGLQGFQTLNLNINFWLANI